MLPVWGLLAGTAIGAMGGKEKREEARAKRMLDVAQERVSGFTGQHADYTAMPSMQKDMLTGALKGFQFGIDNADLDLGGATDASEATAGMASANDLQKPTLGESAVAQNGTGGQGALLGDKTFLDNKVTEAPAGIYGRRRLGTWDFGYGG